MNILHVWDLWVARRCCDCRPFAFVPEVYQVRLKHGSSTKGYPLKLGLNSLYGKLAQRCGRGPYHDAVAAGLITAITRASLIEAVGHDPEAVIMLATDGVYSTRPLPLSISTTKELGLWEHKVKPDLFIAQPGIYWSPSELKAGGGEAGPSDVENKLKSRGVNRSVIGGAAPRFYNAFNELMTLLQQSNGARELMLRERLFPTVPVSIHVFYGCRLALARGKPYLAGTWRDEIRQESFEWNTKRDPIRIEIRANNISTFPPAGSPFAESAGYDPAEFDRLVAISAENGSLEEIDENTLLEAMPDFIPFLPHE